MTTSLRRWLFGDDDRVWTIPSGMPHDVLRIVRSLTDEQHTRLRDLDETDHDETIAGLHNVALGYEEEGTGVRHSVVVTAHHETSAEAHLASSSVYMLAVDGAASLDVDEVLQQLVEWTFAADVRGLYDQYLSTGPPDGEPTLRAVLPDARQLAARLRAALDDHLHALVDDGSIPHSEFQAGDTRAIVAAHLDSPARDYFDAADDSDHDAWVRSKPGTLATGFFGANAGSGLLVSFRDIGSIAQGRSQTYRSTVGSNPRGFFKVRAGRVQVSRKSGRIGSPLRTGSRITVPSEKGQHWIKAYAYQRSSIEKALFHS